MDERQLLEDLYKTCTNYKLRERYHAVLLVKTGMSITQVAYFFYVDPETISMWVRKWNAEKHLEDKKRNGPKSKLTTEQQEEVFRVVDENNPKNEGYDVATWDCAELKIFIQKRFQITLSCEAIRKLLRKNGYFYRKTEYFFTKRDEEQRRAHIAEILNLFDNSLNDTTILFGDEMSTKLHPKPGHVWTRNGTPIVKTNCSHKRVNTIGALSPVTGEKVVGQYDQNDTRSFLVFLQTVLDAIPNNILLYLDNYPVHHSKAVRAFCAQNPRLTLKFMPIYSPDLNPIEWLWGYVRPKFLNGVVHQNVDALKETLARAFEVIKPEKIKEICTLQILKRHRMI